MRVLVVDDSSRIRQAVASGLRAAGFRVDEAADGRQALDLVRDIDFDVVVLDIRMPEMDGLTLLAAIRAAELPAAVLLLSALDTVEDRVRGLQAGADDYLVKPFAFAELLARVQALARRRHHARSPVLTIGDLVVDTALRSATCAGITLELTPREYAILEYLALHRGRVVTREELEAHVYDGRARVQSNSIDSAIYALRRKLGAGGGRPLIHTRRGAGYVLHDVELPA